MKPSYRYIFHNISSVRVLPFPCAVSLSAQGEQAAQTDGKPAPRHIAKECSHIRIDMPHTDMDEVVKVQRPDQP